MTNYERIKNMSVEEMAEKFDKGICGCECCVKRYSDEPCHFDNCRPFIKQWLETEVEE
jgi:hypothetical protein